MTNNRKMEETFEQLISLAWEKLDSSTEAGHLQAIALETRRGSTHILVTADLQRQEQIIQILTEQQDTQVSYLVAMWQGGCLDVPSYDFRKKLITLNRENEKTLMALRGEGHLGVRTVGSTM